MSIAHDHYSQHLEFWKEKEQQQSTKVKVLSMLRVLAFAICSLGIYFHLQSERSVWLVPAALGVVLFIYFIQRHIAAKYERDFRREMIHAYALEQVILSGKWEREDNGEVFSDPTHNYVLDLDIFGANSVYCWLDRCTTIMGKDALAKDLKKGVGVKKVLERQQTIQALIPQQDKLQESLAHARLQQFSASDRERLLSFVSHPPTIFSHAIWKMLVWIVPAISLLATAAWIINLITLNQLIVFLLIPLGLILASLSKINKVHNKLSRLGNAMEALSRTCRESLHVKGETAEWQKLKSTLQEAAENLEKLAKLLSQFDFRNNFIVAVLLNIYLFWDVRCVLRLQKWLRSHGSQVEVWLNAIGEYQKLASLAINGFNTQEQQVWPKLNSTVGLETKGLLHPTLLAQGGVPQVFDQATTHNIALVTGANMAGKSTFLRAVGVSWVMANMGSPVLAEHYIWNGAALFSSMRTSDSLAAGRSYFHAELSRLKSLMDFATEKGKCLILLDEILKGTNSKDKAEGSASFVRKLAKLNLQAIVATHDLSLCELEEEIPERVENWYFDVKIVNDDLAFDYTIRRGVCQTMNAAFLMKKMGIVE